MKASGGILMEVLAIIAVTFVLVYGALYFFSIPMPKQNKAPSYIAKGNKIGGDKDDHGCLVAAGYRWCADKNKCLRAWEETCLDIIQETFDRVSEQLTVGFRETVPVEFTWQFDRSGSVGELYLKGLRITAKRLTNSEYKEVIEFMDDDAFNRDLFNVNAATISGQTGYSKSNLGLVCLLGYVRSDFNGDEPLEAPDTGIAFERDVSLTCGLIDNITTPKLSDENLITKSLALKNEKKVSQTTVDISSITPEHARGVVRFEPGDSGNYGIFLAIKLSGQWTIAHDGNESPDCEGLNVLRFPKSMLIGVCE
jgi:hypothetical protein